MADFIWTKEVAHRSVFRLTLPTNAVEITKAFVTAEQELDRLYEAEYGPNKKRHGYDDDIEVSSDGEYLEIIIGGKWEREPHDFKDRT